MYGPYRRSQCLGPDTNVMPRRSAVVIAAAPANRDASTTATTLDDASNVPTRSGWCSGRCEIARSISPPRSCSGISSDGIWEKITRCVSSTWSATAEMRRRCACVSSSGTATRRSVCWLARTADGSASRSATTRSASGINARPASVSAV
ncbi:Uncharacterised protein [Mycobacteroides abscessus subsp. abscessus]|nr:Uncharacterised protein [Mycobacteroides abscessus subsp. abscessus]